MFVGVDVRNWGRVAVGSIISAAGRGSNVPASVIDLHCHVLPGIDDGPATIEGSLALARVAAAAGTHVLVATPHVNWRYRNDAAGIARLVEELQPAPGG